ncbi:hypothetical protein K493DRAFT_303887 [Basidiobolus meristosporus CBS 931.73]|uniref:Uncharacterized protein n=1 Tax=Basidiobolus meristosporus CBS 931.73 TaxID=1314790 RepID=A0A1Y1Y1C5_9FUNG|nr:hypothetical protein K493DRAFT_303887 [Basidiobolus meristosporus CBS 931.73]|eukprot:ORX91695.1 hypothetical protein K493DRAFT_303887 [Basidiobolus meristosporus CBS 931.73]
MWRFHRNLIDIPISISISISIPIYSTFQSHRYASTLNRPTSSAYPPIRQPLHPPIMLGWINIARLGLHRQPICPASMDVSGWAYAGLQCFIIAVIIIITITATAPCVRPKPEGVLGAGYMCWTLDQLHGLEIGSVHWILTCGGGGFGCCSSMLTLGAWWMGSIRGSRVVCMTSCECECECGWHIASQLSRSDWGYMTPTYDNTSPTSHPPSQEHPYMGRMDWLSTMSGLTNIPRFRSRPLKPLNPDATRTFVPHDLTPGRIVSSASGLRCDPQDWFGSWRALSWPVARSLWARFFQALESSDLCPVKEPGKPSSSLCTEPLPTTGPSMARVARSQV